MPDEQPSVRAITGRSFAEQSAFFRQKLGNLVPTSRWDDIERGAHDQGFMVAGAAKADLLSDLAAASDRFVSEGRGIGEFRKDFRDIVERNGWHGWTGEESAKGRAWRTRVIYKTNAQTSYSAGRLAQLQDAEFTFWVYRHGGSRDPRKQHLSWDGLTLPPDHPFWATHYPPNGWGCSCYVVGAHRQSSVRRLGGEPDKALPDGWDATDSKTGAPPGIDQGWDYQPGARVSRTVSQMAEKARAWDYSIAKGYMQEMPASVRDRLATSYRALPSVADDARRYAERVMRGDAADTLPVARTLGLATEADNVQIRDAIDESAALHDFALDVASVLEVQRAEAGARALTSEDFAYLPQLLNSGSTFTAAGEDTISRRLTIGGETFIAVWRLVSDRRQLVLQSFRVEAP
ncbi:phage minor head protein [Salinicola sp. JS01]|uniref:phage head morphogenesis protein n=1 Tax=Salinicola sp. JS01 TaxID=3050071 RepID=UPI00255B521A|nr:phage minor head protein [Salinicola sp. JS01]WIX31241.1 phage minor head protein [Salinicola sp. JS01]